MMIRGISKNLCGRSELGWGGGKVVTVKQNNKKSKILCGRSELGWGGGKVVTGSHE